MKSTSSRLLIVALCVCGVAFVSSGLLRNATHGFTGALGDLAWFTFLLSALAAMALAVVVIVTSTVRRRRASVR